LKKKRSNSEFGLYYSFVAVINKKIFGRNFIHNLFSKSRTVFGLIFGCSFKYLYRHMDKQKADCKGKTDSGFDLSVSTEKVDITEEFMSACKGKKW
jgi:hypothetical protein